MVCGFVDDAIQSWLGLARITVVGNREEACGTSLGRNATLSSFDFSDLVG